MTWWNDRRMLQYIWHELDKRFQSRVAGSARSKTVIDLALDNYLAGEAKDSSLDTMDLTFRDFATSQLRTFVFAGHDSTSSTICYAFHLLSVHPNARRLLIAELDEVLGSDHTQAAAKISENPHVLNQLLYTTAVIKETLRLYPPASSTRSGEPGYSFPGPNGVQFPTERFYLVWSNAYGVQRDPKHWPEADKFLPERWTAQEGDLLYPPRGVFRPFEFGPRNCIGQELAMLELKIVLATTMQEFNITSVYDEWDRLHPSKGIKTLDGDRAYQILFGAAHPNDGLPCRVSLAAR
jgi:cytochrome P450